MTKKREITIHVNHLVSVELTELGQAILKKNSKKTVSEDGRLRMPLWDLMLTFGDAFVKRDFTMTGKVPFKNNTLFLSDEVKVEEHEVPDDEDGEEDEVDDREPLIGK